MAGAGSRGGSRPVFGGILAGLCIPRWLDGLLRGRAAAPGVSGVCGADARGLAPSLSAVSLLLLVLTIVPAAAASQDPTEGAQDPAPTPPTLVPRVFFDCRGPRCNSTYYRTDIDWVAWVRDQRDAHVHVIMTSQQTGVGGREFILDFIGNGTYQDYEVRNLYQALPTDTEREDLDGVALTLGLGLAQFATQSGFRDLVGLTGLARVDEVSANLDAPPEGVLSPDEVQDPWNLWVFRVNANGDVDSESAQQSVRIQTGLRASRVTPVWNQRYNFYYTFRERRFDLSDGSTFQDDRFDWNVSSRVIYALADSWSIGFTGNVGRNTSRNQELWGQWNPAIEYSFFPYEEATRRALTAFYQVGPVYREYIEQTVFEETEELRFEQQMTLEFSQRQTWGDASIRLRGSTYLHDTGLNNISTRGDLSFRIARGLDLEIGASYSRVRDQLFLSGAGLSDEERLLELQQQATDYEASIEFGFTYQFGSIFNNVVNNRFPGGGGFF